MLSVNTTPVLQAPTSDYNQSVHVSEDISMLLQCYYNCCGGARN